jgi:hypothetical protein
VTVVVVRAEVAMLVGLVVDSVVARPVGHTAVEPQP